MSVFKKFFFGSENENNDQMLLLSEELKSNLSKDIAENLYKDKEASLSDENKKEFSVLVSEIVHDKKFIGDLSDNIGTPFPFETEDDFVQRASQTMTILLKKKFKI